MPPHLPALTLPPHTPSSRVNVTLGPREDRVLMTGLHTVCDIHCTTCESVLGWKYEVAFEESQKYKEGKFIIEKAKILKVRAGDGQGGCVCERKGPWTGYECAPHPAAAARCSAGRHMVTLPRHACPPP